MHRSRPAEAVPGQVNRRVWILRLYGRDDSLSLSRHSNVSLIRWTRRHSSSTPTTTYSDGDDYIGNHSDKVEDWAPGSAFVVIKLGDPRPFVFTQSVDGVEVKIYNEVLLAGTAVIVGYNANLKVKHGVPPVGSCGASGLVVGRCITTEFE